MEVDLPLTGGLHIELKHFLVHEIFFQDYKLAWSNNQLQEISEYYTIERNRGAVHYHDIMSCNIFRKIEKHSQWKIHR